VLSEESSDNSLGQRKKVRDDDDFIAPAPSPSNGNEMESVSIEEEKPPKKKLRGNKKPAKGKR
jgi:hypothetical protein